MRKLVRFALPFGAACAASVYLLPLLVSAVAAGVCLAALIAASLVGFRQKQTVCLCLAGLTAGLAWTAAYEALFLRPVWEASEEIDSVAAEVCEYPFRTGRGYGLDVRMEAGGRTVTVRLYADGDKPAVEPGDRVEGSVKLQPSLREESEKNDLYLQSRGCVLRGTIKNPVYSPGRRTALRYLPTRCAELVRCALRASVPEDAAPYLCALLTGDKSGLDETVKYDMSAAGISHTVAVSGMHVAMLMAAVYLLVGRNPRLSALLGIPLLVFFVFMTGASPSVIRAALMLTAVLLAPLVHREYDPPSALCAAMLLILTLNPFTAANVSFQLSFGAMAGIFLCTGRLYRYMIQTGPAQFLTGDRRIPARLRRVSGGVTKWVCACVAATLGALAFTTPLIALHFGRVGLYGVVSNLLVLWAVTICFVGGMLTAVTALCWLPAGRVLGWALAWPVRWILAVSRRIAGWPNAVLSVDDPYVLGFLVFLYGLILLAMLLRIRKPWPVLACLGAALAGTLVLNRLDRRPEDFCVTALDVGQGQCICLRTDAFTAVYDCGGTYAGEAGTHAAEYLGGAGVDEIDALILSHYDVDHVGGVWELLYRMQVDCLYLPDVADDTGIREKIEQAADRFGVPRIYVTQDLTLNNDDDRLTIYAPVSYYDDNSASLALRFQAGDYTVVATGDMDRLAEHELMRTHELGTAELLIAGHHGSRSAVSTELLEQLQPGTVIISVGENSYGHPDAETLDRIAQIGAEVYRTDECGDIEIRR